MVRDSDIRNLEMPEENAVGNSIAHRQHRLLGDDEAVIGYQVSLLDMHIATRRAQIERGIIATVLLVMGVPCIVTVAILAVTVTEMHALEKICYINISNSSYYQKERRYTHDKTQSSKRSDSCKSDGKI